MLLRVRLKGKMAHFGTPFSNHTSKLSHLVPSKSVMNGMLGASKGLSFYESQDLSYRYSFKWVSDLRNQLIAKKRLVLDIKNNVKNVLRSVEWERGELKGSVDYIEHLYSHDGFIEADWFIEVLDGSEDEIEFSLTNPVFPLYFGVSENFIRVLEIERLYLPKKEGKNKFSGFFVGVSDSWLMKERMVEKMRGYRNPASYEDVYTLSQEIEGECKYGYYEIEGYNISMW
jgi:CRISPR-associated Cas5-like protein